MQVAIPHTTMIKFAWCLALLAMQAASCGAREPQQSVSPPATSSSSASDSQQQLELATFGSGCFWCTEAVFENVKGVEKVVSGYSGGALENPTYKAVLTGMTGHAEVVQLAFDPDVISYADLLEIFWKTHDPTTLNRQGPDVGTQYRSVILYHNDAQKETATAYKKQLNEEHAFKDPIVTEISPFKKFYPAEAYHQDFYRLNSRHGYCTRYIKPKIRKFNRMFEDKRKERE